jgi:phenylacetate-CoA ligase
MGMYPSLFRRAVFPVLDRVNGTSVSALLRFLEESQWWSRDALHAFQREKLQATLDWTHANSDFYRTFWRTARHGRRARSSYQELDGLPVVTKNDLRAHAAAFPLSAYGGRSIRVATSGSTGEPMVYYRSARQDSWFWALRLRMWEWGGYILGDPYITLNLNPRTALRKRIQDVLFRCSYHGFNANDHDVQAVLRDFERRRIHHLIGYSSSLFLLASAMRRLGMTMRMTSILSTGDTLLPAYRQLVEEVLGAGVVDYYGAGGEGIHLASQCSPRSQYHLHLENSVIEILRDGRPAAPGEFGEVVVTQLDNQAMPLVRYATQDVAIPGDEKPCDCGRGLPVIAGVQGRVPDIVFAPDGTALVVHFFTILFEHIPDIRQFQIVQERPDEIVARVVSGERYDAAKAEIRVREEVARVTSGSLRVVFEYVDEIPLADSGKRRFVVSRVVPDVLSAVPARPIDAKAVPVES